MAAMKKNFVVLAVAFLVLTGCSTTESVPTTASPSWLQNIEQQAIESGVSSETVHAALDNFVPNPKVVTLDQKQPETTITFAAYRHNIISPARVKKGAELMRDYAGALSEAEAQTGVPPQIVVALWGIESNFGQNMGDYETINSLATLAYEGRRADLFRGELFAALHILDREHMSAAELRGSWAGAMGQCQFMPSTYLKYAVDADNTGRADIWNDPIDVIASIAHYLSAEGWAAGLTWGQAVNADGMDASEIGMTQTHSIAEWTAKGVTKADGSPLASQDIQMSLIQPDGVDGPSFLVSNNFRALMRWNRSTYFATSVGLLADEIRAEAGLPGF